MPRNRPLAVPHEHIEQKTVFEWAAAKKNRYTCLRWLHAIPNGGNRSKAEAGKFKAEGVKSGVNDICLPVPAVLIVDNVVLVYSGLYIEMKRTKGGSVSQDQADFADYVRGGGYRAVVCRGANPAIDELENYCNAILNNSLVMYGQPLFGE